MSLSICISEVLTIITIGKGDTPSSSASARDIQREKQIDMHLKIPPKLPAYLSEHDRRASRVDVEVRVTHTILVTRC
jgi:hypothetical protein